MKEYLDEPHWDAPLHDDELEFGEVPMNMRKPRDRHTFSRASSKPAVNLESGAQCRVCGSTDVRWRQQSGRWVLMSTQPGVEHKCSAYDLVKDFD